MGVKLERIVKPYYDWLHEGKIMARKCTKCGAVEWPPLLGCNTCGSPDMEWIEMSGKGQMVQMVMPAPITRKPEMNDIKPYCFGVIELPEGPAINAMVRGVDKKNKDLVAAKLPIDVHMVIIPRDGYDTVIFELDEIPKPEK